MFTLCALLIVFLMMQWFDKLLESFNSVSELIKVLSGITMHNILLQGLCKNGDIMVTHKLLDKMPQKENQCYIYIELPKNGNVLFSYHTEYILPVIFSQQVLRIALDRIL